MEKMSAGWLTRLCVTVRHALFLAESGGLVWASSTGTERRNRRSMSASELEKNFMNKIILAATLAISSVIAIPAVSYADSITIRTDNGPGLHRGWDRGNRGPHARMVRDHRGPRDCMTKKVTTFRHGERVTKVTKVCR